MDNEKTTTQQIVANIADELHMSVRSLALGMNIAYTRLFDVYSGRVKKIAPDIAKAFQEIYHINEEYLKSGKGEIRSFADSANASSDPITDSFINVINKMSKRKTELEDEIKALHLTIEELKAENAELRSKVTE